MVSLFTSKIRGDVFLGLNSDDYAGSKFHVWVNDWRLSSFASAHRRLADYYKLKTGLRTVDPEAARAYFLKLRDERQMQYDARSLIEHGEDPEYNLLRSIRIMVEYMDLCDEFEDRWEPPDITEFEIENLNQLDSTRTISLLIANDVTGSYCDYNSSDWEMSEEDEQRSEKFYSAHSSLSLASLALYNRIIEKRPTLTGILQKITGYDSFVAALRAEGIVVLKFETEIVHSNLFPLHNITYPSEPSG
jgi:hypothetical protein